LDDDLAGEDQAEVVARHRGQRGRIVAQAPDLATERTVLRALCVVLALDLGEPILHLAVVDVAVAAVDEVGHVGEEPRQEGRAGEAHEPQADERALHGTTVRVADTGGKKSSRLPRVRWMWVLVAVGCGASEPSVPACAPGWPVAGAAVGEGAPAGTTLACSRDLALAGFAPLGPAVALSPARAATERPFRLTLPYRKTPRSQVLVAVRRP